MTKFKIGDRVITTGRNRYYAVGQTGTVDEDSSCPFVLMDDPRLHPRPAIHQDTLKLLKEEIQSNYQIY